MTVSRAGARRGRHAFELVGGADPYFTNVDPNQEQCLLVSARICASSRPRRASTTRRWRAASTFGADSVAGAYDYIQHLIKHLNSQLRNPGGDRSFQRRCCPSQSGALDRRFVGDAVFAAVLSFPPVSAINYNFAVARVPAARIGRSGRRCAEREGVFPHVGHAIGGHGLPDRDRRTRATSTRRACRPHRCRRRTATRFRFSHRQRAELRRPEQRGIRHDRREQSHRCRLPRAIRPGQYFGCFLNIYDGSNVVNGAPVQAHLAGTHHCIVAQIAYDDAPIINAGGVTMSPENSDKLASGTCR